VSAHAGERDSAQAVLAWALRETENAPELRVDLLHEAAFLRLALGDRDGARALLGQYLDARPQYRSLVAGDAAFRRLGLDLFSVGTR
jgi:hypothetical protein